MDDYQPQIARPKSFDGSSRQQQEAPRQENQRAETALRVSAMLAQFWQDHDTPRVMRALEIEGWCDVLRDCSQDEIREAWRTYQIGGSRTASGRLYRPDAGAIFHLIGKERARLRLEQRKAEVRLALSSPPEPPREARVTLERGRAILAEVYGADVFIISIASKPEDFCLAPLTSPKCG